MIALFFVGLFVVAIYVSFFVFALSLCIRRWHDLGKSGWYSLLSILPVVNLVVGIYLFAVKGDDAANRYGDVNVGKPFWVSLFGRDTTASLPPASASMPQAPQPPPISLQ